MKSIAVFRHPWARRDYTKKHKIPKDCGLHQVPASGNIYSEQESWQVVADLLRRWEKFRDYICDKCPASSREMHKYKLVGDDHRCFLILE